MKLSDYVMNRVAAEGVTDVFFLPGGGCMHLVDSLGSHAELDCICNLHEQGTAAAVEAYAQVRGFGVGLVTTGPGGTNALTGVAAAWLDSTPTLFISGQVKRADIVGSRGVRQFGFQEIDIVSMVKPITKYAVTVMDPRTIRMHMDRAIHEARTGRTGPVWLDIPLDVQAADIEPDSLPGYSAPPQQLVVDSVDAAARRACDKLTQAKRPVILAGNGIRAAGATGLLLELVEHLQLPLLTTWKGLDFLPEDHPLFAGRPGAIGQRHANLTQQNCDWVLVVGARLDLGQLAYMHEFFARGAEKTVVDIDPGELSKLRLDADRVCADAGDFLRALLQHLPHPLPHWDSWVKQTQTWKEAYPVLDRARWDQRELVDPYVLIEVLSGILGEGDLVVPGSSGQSSELTHQGWRVRPGLRMLNSQGLGPMGFAVPAALGACIASGKSRTVAIDGDGGFQMNLQELETIRRLDLPVKIFVLDNNGYGSIRKTQRAYFDGRLVASDPSSGLTLPDVTKISQAYGIETATLSSHSHIQKRVAALLDQPGPLVCTVKMDPDHQTIPRAVSYRKEDGSMATRPMEDLFPLLDRDELAANMQPEIAKLGGYRDEQ